MSFGCVRHLCALLGALSITLAMAAGPAQAQAVTLVPDQVPYVFGVWDPEPAGQPWHTYLDELTTPSTTTDFLYDTPPCSPSMLGSARSCGTDESQLDVRLSDLPAGSTGTFTVKASVWVAGEGYVTLRQWDGGLGTSSGGHDGKAASGHPQTLWAHHLTVAQVNNLVVRVREELNRSTTRVYAVRAEAYPIREDGPPEVDVTGTLAERDGGYVGAGVVALTATADDTVAGDPVVSGIRRIELSRDGGGTVIATAPCSSSGCPATFTHGFAVDTRTVPEGELTVRVHAFNDAGNVSDEALIFALVDKTPPSPPSRIALEDFDSAQGTATLDWVEGDDPDLVGGLPSAGTKYTEYRRQAADGSWGVWHRFENASDATIGALSNGERVTVEFRAIDAVGNYSSVVSAQLTASEDPPPSAQPRAPGTAADDPYCDESIDYTSNRLEDPDYHRFKPWRNVLGAQLRIACHPATPFAYAEIQGQFAYRAGQDENGPIYVRVGEPGTDVRKVRPGDTVKARGFNAVCEAQMAGRKEYVIFGRIRFSDLPPDEGFSPADTTEWFDFHTPLDEPSIRHCPPVSTLHRRQQAGWRYLLKYSAAYLSDPEKRTRESGGYWLGDALGDPPWTPPGVGPRQGWEAHHTVPQTQSGFDAFRALLFRVCVHPNSALNGVYLRARPLRRRNDDGSENDNYRQLREHDERLANRTYHPDTRRLTYLEELSTALRTQVQVEDQTCDSGGVGGRVDVVAKLSGFNTRLLNGMLLVDPPN
jgi:hypothetical protein